MLSLFYSRLTSVFWLPALFIATFVSAFPAMLSGQGCGCTNCPQFMPDNFVGSFTINVSGADNPTLGQNGQGVCGVNIHFDHEYLGDLRITLTSPSGQTVTLIGPIGFFGPTDGSSWNISFVPCNGNPDPDPGFSAQWNNNQNWGLNGTYTGSYFPQQGCLENFNSGPVDGTWTLTVTDGQALDVGNFYDYEIIFCDPSGIECFSCAADAGNLPQPDVTACQGSPNLDLSLPPTYTAPSTAPPASEYSYTYIVGGAGGVILAYEDGPNLQGYDPGSYTVCGLSYYTNHAGDLPDPNGSLTIAQLSSQLNGGNPPFCGHITGNCVNVNILARPDDIEEEVEVCFPACYTFFNTNYCQTGVYVRNLSTPQGCQYTATLRLTVRQPSTVNISEFICSGDCATTEGFEQVCTPGIHQNYFQNQFGCDSIVRLNLQVLNVAATANPTGQISCTNPQVQISGIGSSTGANVTYHWTASSGGNIVSSPNGINVVVNAAGDYTLEVCRTGAGVTCCTSTMVTLVDNSTPPPAPASISGPAQVCVGDTVTYTADVVTVATSYVWTLPAEASIIGSSMGSSVQVVWGSGGSGQVCAASNNACGTSPAVCMAVTAIPQPIAAMLSGPGLACPSDTVFYLISNPAPTSNYAWNINGGSFVSQPSGSAVQVAWGSSASVGLICAVASNTCAVTPETCLNIGLSIPVAGPIAEQCDPTNSFYTISFPITGGTPTYTIPGGTVSNGVFLSDSIVSGNPFTFIISDANNCVSAPISGSFNCICSTGAGDVGLSLLQACEGQTVTADYLGGEMLDANDVSSFVLHNGAGTGIVPPIFGQNTTGEFGFVAGMEYGQTYYISRVAGNNLAGFPDLNDPCLSVSQGQPVVFYEIPTALAGADFDTCGLSLALSANAGPGLGTWSVVSAPNGASLNINSINNPLSPATASAHGAYLLAWSLNNNGCTDSDTLALHFNDSPSITNFSAACDGANENFVVSFDITGGTPNFDVQGSPSGTLSATAFQSPPIPNGGSYAYTVTDANGCASEPLSGAFSCNCATEAGDMSAAPLAACEGGSVSAQHLGGEFLDANDVAAYILHSQSGSFLGQIFAQNTTGTFSFQNGMSYGTTYYISYVVGNDLGGFPDPNDPCLSVSLGQPAVFYQNPVAQAGADLKTCGTQLNLNANSPAGSSGQWSVSGTPTGGSLMFDDPLSPSTGVTSNVYGTYSLTWTLLQNGCVGTDQTILQFNDSPKLADLLRFCDAANENFQVELTISGGTAPYTVNGQPIAGNVFTSGNFANGATYTFDVNDNNGCSMPAVSGAFSCNCTTDAGTMSAQMLELCQGADATAITSGNAVLDPNDVSGYVLHNGAGPALGQVIAQNTTGTFSFVPGQMSFGTTYYISLVAGNALAGFPDPSDPCFSVAPGQPVRWLQNPAPNVGPDFSVCGSSAGLQAGPSPYPGLWSLVSGPGAADFTAPSNLSCSVNVSTAGTYTFRWTAQNGICSGSDELSVTFNPLPTVTALAEICDGTNTTFQVSFTAANGQAPYMVSGLSGVFSGNNFASDPLLSTSTYAFVLFDGNGCESPAVIGAHNCDCSTDAGSMLTTLAEFCAGTPATGVWNNDAVTDANDIVRFILHDSPGANAGSTIFAVSDQPVFNFGPNLQFGVTYYISAIAGNNNGGNVDLNDPCLSVAPGTPVRWKPLPQAQISGDATICAGGSAVLSLSGTGTYPLTLSYNAGSVANTLILTGPQVVTLNVSPTTTTSYVLTGVADGTLPACTSPLSAAATVTVNQPESAGTPLPSSELCFGSGQTIPLASLLAGTQPGGQWSEVSSLPSQGGAFNASSGTFQPNGQPPATYSFRYRLTALPPCTDDEATVSVIIHPRPIADAGADKTLTCNAVTALVGGANTSLGEYRWLFDGDTVSAERQLLAKEGGTYTLLVTNAQGCTATDQVLVTEDKEVPLANAVLHNDVRCFGEQNGSISIESVVSSRPPVLYSLNGGPFGASPLFNRLGPGEYMLTLQDAIGCESEIGPITVGQPPQLTADLGGDLSLQLADSAHLALQTSVPWQTLASIEWQPLLDPGAAGKPYQNFLPLQSWEMRVTVKDSAGCTATDRILVRLNKPHKVFIPNIFSPDKGIVPFVGVYGGRDVELVELFQIFDRWGELVFEQRNFLHNDDSFAWNGRVKGQTANPGVFTYYAKVRFIDGETVLFTGDVTLVR